MGEGREEKSVLLPRTGSLEASPGFSCHWMYFRGHSFAQRPGPCQGEVTAEGPLAPPTAVPLLRRGRSRKWSWNSSPGPSTCLPGRGGHGHCSAQSAFGEEPKMIVCALSKPSPHRPTRGLGTAGTLGPREPSSAPSCLFLFVQARPSREITERGERDGFSDSLLSPRLVDDRTFPFVVPEVYQT